MVGELPPSNGFTHVLTACDYFSIYFFAIHIRKPDTKSVVEALMQISTQRSYVPNTILIEKGSTITYQLFSTLMESDGIKLEYATVKHAQTIGMMERSHQNITTPNRELLTATDLLQCGVDSSQRLHYVGYQEMRKVE